MLTKHNAIVLSKIKYSDYDLIVKSYTKEQGVVSYILKGVLKSKKGKAKVAYFQPLSLLQIEANYKPNRSLHFINDVRFNYVYKSLHTNVYKSSIAVFLSEILNTVLQEESPNKDLYHFIEAAFQYVDNETHFANFHLLFLLKLTKYLGFYPQYNNSKASAYFFNMESGIFEATKTSIYSIDNNNLTILKTLLGINFDALSSIKINSNQRQAFLNMVLRYFDLHLAGFKMPKSLQIFIDVFH